jgi:molecular chaperone HtpG
VLTELKKQAEKKADEYASFWENFGPVLKEGLYEDNDRRDDLLTLARFRSTAGDGWVSLADYVARMKENQTAIYYITGDDVEAMKASPQLEGYRARDIEVLLLADPVDDFWLSVVMDFDGKPLKSATRGASDLADIEPAQGDEEAAAEAGDEARDAEVATLIALIKQSLADEVKDVRTTDRLTDSPVCLVADDGDLDLRLERMLKAHNQLQERSSRIMEINPKHALIRNMIRRAGEKGAAEALDDAAHLLLDQARIVEGEPVADPAAFTRRMSAMMSKATGG